MIVDYAFFPFSLVALAPLNFNGVHITAWFLIRSYFHEEINVYYFLRNFRIASG